MVVRTSHIITLPSGNLARDFLWESLGYGRVRVQYVYTDRRRAHQTSRRYTVEFLNGKVETIQARSAKGGRVEFFKRSSIINELLEMLAEVNEDVQDVQDVQDCHEPSKVEETETEQDTTSKASELADASELVEANKQVEDDKASELVEASELVDASKLVEEDNKANDTSNDLMNTVRLVWFGVVVNLMVTLVTLGIVWYNL